MEKEISMDTNKPNKMSFSQKIAFWCGIFILGVVILSLINDLIFYDTSLGDGSPAIFRYKYLNADQKANFKNGLINWGMRFTYLTVHINVFIGAALINYALNKNFQMFARRLLNFAIVLLIVGVLIYWIFISFELHNRFNNFHKDDDTRSFHEYLHVYISHGLTLIVGLIGYAFAKKDLVIVKKDAWYSMAYVAFYIFFYLIMFSLVFSKAYKGINGTYEEKMAAGHKATWNLYRFIDPTRPFFMENPIPNVSRKFLWFKAISLEIILITCLLLATTLTFFSMQRMFRIKTFATEKKYKEFARNFKALKNYNLSIEEAEKQLANLPLEKLVESEKATAVAK